MNFRELTVYKKAFKLAMEIFEESKQLTYSLIDQIRRSSRSVCSNIGEAYRKRQYNAYFVNKISDSDMENTETQVWLDFAKSCDYLSLDSYNKLLGASEEVGRLLNHMITYPERYLSASSKNKTK